MKKASLLLVLLLFLSLLSWVPQTAKAPETYLVNLSGSKTQSYLRVPSFGLSSTTHNIYETKIGDEDVLEWELIVSRKPLTNTISFPIQSSGLRFYFQPALDRELNAKDYDFLNSTHAIRKGNVTNYRPQNIVDSYAVYDSKTGLKVYHIYRIRVWDAANNWVWGTQNITGGTWTITVPQIFLNSAIYPIVIDPSFGKTDIGGSTHSNSYRKMACRYQAPATGTITQLNIYGKETWSSTGNLTLCIYTDDSGSPDALLEYETITNFDGTLKWWSASGFSTSITSSEYYWLTSLTFGPWITIYYDSGDTDQFAENVDESGLPPEDPFDKYYVPTYQDWAMSIFANYTTGGGQEFTYSFSETIVFSDGLSLGRESAFQGSESFLASSSLMLGRESAFGGSEVSSITTVQGWGVEAWFSPQDNAVLDYALQVWQERLFRPSGTYTVSDTLVFGKELLITEYDYVVSETASLSGLLYHLIEYAVLPYATRGYVLAAILAVFLFLVPVLVLVWRIKK